MSAALPEVETAGERKEVDFDRVSEVDLRLASALEMEALAIFRGDLEISDEWLQGSSRSKFHL